MNGAHLHLIFNHFPIVGIFFSVIVLALALKFDSEALRKTGLFLVLVTGALTVLTFLTGEPAEGVIENLPGISKDLIHAHEEAAETSAWITWAAAVVGLVGLYLGIRKQKTPRWSVVTVLLIGLLSLGFLVWSNNLGGKIGHAEIREIK